MVRSLVVMLALVMPCAGFAAVPPDAAGRTSADKAAEARFTRLDKNKDGVVSRDEAGKRLAARFDRLDANRDGVLSRAELAAPRKAPARRGQAV